MRYTNEDANERDELVDKESFATASLNYGSIQPEMKEKNLTKRLKKSDNALDESGKILSKIL